MQLLRVGVRVRFVDWHLKCEITLLFEQNCSKINLKDKYTGLKYAELTTMTNDECRKMSMPQAPIKDFTTLCAYSGNKGIGICIGKCKIEIVHN